ncbi:hypothetical protein P152DRAFT_448186 [Eremomyces bilateralis CBS 781.70]|uniref:Uncharacterized protein n=1 Tax=Eremomyces bilateralis CBS 781.70 TaxID=1392243 RepID=A0A6G1G6V8_9PEZI|nr:uncharacterized protein P152DRAFT_448186 [Eremomyces bilateralis CBS 781.70]KAF1813778.1 hypothetical protein P152DRAFT_448186 [Eremomyces bilateralis CBS 781.70]
MNKKSSQEQSLSGLSLVCEGSSISTLTLDMLPSNASGKKEALSSPQKTSSSVPSTSSFEKNIKDLSSTPPTESIVGAAGPPTEKHAATRGVAPRRPIRSRGYSLDRYLNTPETHEQIAVEMSMESDQPEGSTATERTGEKKPGKTGGNKDK